MDMPLRAILVLLLSLPALATAQNTPIPPVHATAFSGEQIDLPQGLHGHSAVLIVSFSQSSRDAVTLWGRRLAADYLDSPTVLYYEMPVLAAVPRLLRSMVLNKIKNSVPPRAQPRFVPVLDHEDEWKSAAGFSKQTPDEDAYLLLVDSNGIIRFREPAGSPTDQTYADLKHRLEELHP
jgi:hypothetical protein